MWLLSTLITVWCSKTAIKKAFLSILVFCFLLVTSSAQSLALEEIFNLEQHINMLNEEYSTASFTASPVNGSFGYIHYDPNAYDGETVYFEAIIRCESCSGGNTQVSASLYNDAGVSQTSVTTTSSSYVRIRSGSLILPEDDYTVRFNVDATGGTAYIKAARLVIVQSSNPINNTETQVEIGSVDTSPSTSAVSLSEPKYYLFDADVYDGTLTSYFEATLRTNGNDTSTSYDYDGYDSGGEEWSTNPGNMVNNNTSSYASTSTDGDIELITSNDATSTDLGEINSVEVRAYGYQTNGADGQVFIRPVFSGSSDGDNHTFTPNENLGSTDWSSYFDITTDTNAPATWTWTDIDDLDFDIEFNKGALPSNTVFISIVQIRVSYEDNSVVAYAQLYNRTDATVVSTISTSNNDYQRVRSDALSTNWDTTNDDEYEVRIYTSSGSNDVDIVGGKIIHNQADGTGLKKVELVHQQISTARVQTNTVYTQDTYITQYDPYNYRNANSFKVFTDATIRTTGGTGYLALWNDTDNDIIDTATNSEITTTSTTYQRQRSGNVAYNTDWPTTTKDFTPVVKATPGQSTYVSNSALIIQIQAIDPSMSFSVAGVASSQTNNGITTTVTSTVSSLPFGNIGLASPEYAAHELTMVTNEASTGYTVTAHIASEIQGYYPANNIDPFTGNSATWEIPQLWTSPTGTVANVDTGWFGANTTDTNITGWGAGSSGKFGPMDETPVLVMQGSLPEANDTEYVSYGIEVNVYQPADIYSTTLIYNALPVY